jgi:cell division protein FtsQ
MNPGEPLSTRAPRMKAYNQLVRDLDSSGARYSQDLSEIDLSDLEDVKVRVNDPAGDVLVHLGSSNYLTRYKIYVTHVQSWRQQFLKLESVDLRYDNQIIVNPDMEAGAKQVKLTPAAARAAAAAGVKPAALVTRLASRDRALPKPAFEIADSKLNPKPAPGGVRKPAAKTRVKLKAAKTRRAGRKVSLKKTALRGKPATFAAVKNGSDPARSMAAQKPSAGKRAPPAGLTAAGDPAATTVPKPSPAVAKQQGIQSSN